MYINYARYNICNFNINNKLAFYPYKLVNPNSRHCFSINPCYFNYVYRIKRFVLMYNIILINSYIYI